MLDADGLSQQLHYNLELIVPPSLEVLNTIIHALWSQTDQCLSM